MKDRLYILLADYVKNPSGVYMEHVGEGNEDTAEYFRQHVLLPFLSEYQTVHVDLADQEIAANWLMWAFGGLITYGYLTLDEFKKRVFVTGAHEKFYTVKVNQYATQAEYGSKIYKSSKMPKVEHADKEILVLVYEKFESSCDPKLKALCFEFTGTPAAISTRVTHNDTLAQPILINSVGAITFCTKLHKELDLSFNIFSCDDRSDTDEQIEELRSAALNSKIRFRALRSLSRTCETTVYD